MKRNTWALGATILLAFVMIATSGAFAQRSRRKKQAYEEKLWDYLTENKYRNWAPVPGESDDAYEGESPHGAYLKMYLNRKAAGNPAELPDGSIIIKENYAEDKKTLMAITVMLRSKNFDEDNGDWYWAKFNADGTIARTSKDAGDKKIAGKVGKCADCHGDAKGGDFVFFNDKE